ncbi:MAG: DNA repair protein RecN [Thermoanaerobaculia bacterium]|nr:DNA repair protein RecN [Thermoanaerobaculia bacterium]
MLRELHVKNLAVLESATVTFGAGFNVLSGETGAGKSIVVDSLALLAGARASAELIRTGADALAVTGVFEPAGDAWRAVLVEAGLDAPDGELLVRREIHRSGRNRVFLNDEPATLRLLADLGPHLLRIHGQREELGLVQPDLQRAWLDRSGGREAAPLRSRVAAAHARFVALHERLQALAGGERTRLERLDFLRFQVEEIDAVRPVAGEDDELRAEREGLRHREAIVRALGTAVDLLAEDETSAVVRLARSAAALGGIEAWEGEAAGWRAELEELQVRVDEVARGARHRLEGREADPMRLDAVEERLAALERLARKYGGSAAAVVAHRERVAAELDDLEGGLVDRGSLEADAARALEEYRAAAEALSAARERWGQQLARRVEGEIAELGLGKARLAVALERRRREGSPLVVGEVAIDFGPEGYDQVAFLFAPNLGEEPQPLAKIASGGELSRVSLGLQLATRGEHEATSTLIFDEVDSGIGGAQAAALGKKLRRLAGTGGQILAVTHVPQVASYGHHHFRVRKELAGTRTVTAVERLAGAEERVDEIARMLAGETITELSRSHARELLAGGGE